jgi:hypothetical protein
MIGYKGYATISAYDDSSGSYYDALQVQANRRFGGRLQFAANWTFQKTMTFTRQQWVSDYVTRASSGRPNAVNLTLGYAIPDGSHLVGKNVFTKGVLDGWHVNGVGSFFQGTFMTIGCTAQSAPIGWPNGTPTGGIPLRCEMTGNLWLPAGTPAPSTASSGLWYPFNSASFSLPPGSTLGLGNTPPTLTLGPGFENIDCSIYKQFPFIKEGWLLEFRAEAYNALNHFDPNNPNTSLTINYNTGANTASSFGTITSAANTARHIVLSLRVRF